MRKRIAETLTGLAIFVGALALIYAIAVGISAVKLHQAYAAMKKDGRPMKMTDLVAQPIPDAENAALLYESAILQLLAQSVSPMPPSPGTPLSATSLLKYLETCSGAYTNNVPNRRFKGEFKELLQSDVVSSALRSIEEGTTRPACQFIDAFDEEGFPLSPRQDGRLRVLARILAAKALWEAETGRMDQAWDTAITLLRFANALRTERWYLSSQLAH